ncbi:MAG: HesA/MoeB/ThiF family protein [Candidatus Thorarchaeota archaeon]
MLALHDFAEEDMLKLVNTTVSVVGAGGLGSPALRMLAAMGLGTIRIIDRDVVELSNIQRQTVYNTDDIDKPKAEAAAANLVLMNPEVKFEPICASINEGNALELLGGSDIIIDGLDSFHTRHAINRASISLGIPYIFAGAIEYHSNLTTFVPGETGCLHCLVGEAMDDPNYTCEIVGVSAELLSVVAAIEVREAILLAIGRKPNLAGRLMTIDLNSLSFDIFEIGKSEKCPTCSIEQPKPMEETKGLSISVLCSGTFSIAPGKMKSLDIKGIAKRLRSKYAVKETSRSVSVETPDGVKLTLMKRGTAVVRGTDSEGDALALYKKIIDN